LANAIPRVFQNDTPEDKKAIQPVINQIVAYPLKDFTGKVRTIEWSKVPNIPGPASSGEETKWVVPETNPQQSRGFRQWPRPKRQQGR
jgi:hypothetical protein